MLHLKNLANLVPDLPLNTDDGDDAGSMMWNIKTLVDELIRTRGDLLKAREVLTAIADDDRQVYAPQRGQDTNYEIGFCDGVRHCAGIADAFFEETDKRKSP